MREGESYGHVAARLAQALRTRLTDEEFLDLLDVEGDYATSDFLYKALTDVADRPPLDEGDRRPRPPPPTRG